MKLYKTHTIFFIGRYCAVNTHDHKNQVDPIKLLQPNSKANRKPEMEIQKASQKKKRICDIENNPARMF